MKKLGYILILIAAVLSSCNDYETYGDKKDKERNAISKFLSDSSIVVISEDQFEQQGQTTDVGRNEFVKLDKSGVYMQIVRKGCGSMLQDGQKGNIVCRFLEYNIMADSVELRNNTSPYVLYPDIMYVSRSGGTFTAAFLSGMMYNAYSSYSSYSTSVPSGWLVPFSYIKIGRPQSDDEECAKVRLIVPHTQGHALASRNVVPYYYEITYQKE